MPVPALVSTVQQRHGLNERIQQKTINVIQRLEYLSIRGWKSWYSSVWRREGSGIPSVHTNTWRDSVQRTQPGCFQCVQCQERMKWEWNETLESRSEKQEKAFPLAQVAGRSCGVSIHGDIQKPSRHSSGQSALGDLACGTHSCSGASSLSHSVIIWKLAP